MLSLDQLLTLERVREHPADVERLLRVARRRLAAAREAQPRKRNVQLRSRDAALLLRIAEALWDEYRERAGIILYPHGPRE